MHNLPEWWTSFWILMRESLTIDPFNFMLMLFALFAASSWLHDKRKIAKVELAKKIARARFDVKNRAFLEALNEVELTYSDDNTVLKARDGLLDALDAGGDVDTELQALLCVIFQRSGLWNKKQSRERNTLRCFKESVDDTPEAVTGDNVSMKESNGKDSRKKSKCD